MIKKNMLYIKNFKKTTILNNGLILKTLIRQ